MISRFMLTAALTLALSGGAVAQDEPTSNTTDPEPAATKPSPAAEQLTKIAESMRGIENRLKDRETGDATQAAQQSVIEQLDQLLNMPPDQSPPPEGGGGGGGSTQQNKPPPSGQSAGKPKPSPKPKPGAGSDPSQMRPKPAGQTGQKDRTNAQDSEERTGPNRPSVNPASKRQRLEVEVWGHLPEKLREQLLSSYGEKMLPQYEDAVRKFYDELANPSSLRNKPK